MQYLFFFADGKQANNYAFLKNSLFIFYSYFQNKIDKIVCTTCLKSTILFVEIIKTRKNHE